VPLFGFVRVYGGAGDGRMVECQLVCMESDADSCSGSRQGATYRSLTVALNSISQGYECQVMSKCSVR